MKKKDIVLLLAFLEVLAIVIPVVFSGECTCSQEAVFVILLRCFPH